MEATSLYTPILKAKEGEFIAVSKLTDSAWAGLTPLFDVQKPDEGKNLLLHLNAIAERVAMCGGQNRPIFVDLLDLGVDARVESGEHPVSYFFHQVREGGFFAANAIPTTGVLADRDEPYLEAIAKVVRLDRRGYCLRLQRRDIDEPEETSRAILALATLTATVPGKIHLLLDFRSVLEDSIRRLATRAGRLIRRLSQQFGFASYTVASSNMPRSVADVVEEWDSIEKVPRVEWRLWDMLRAQFPSLGFRFADYSIVAPDFVGVRGGNENINAKIRYTTSSNYVLLRGRPLYKPVQDFTQFYDLAASLVRMEEFSGAEASWGDRQIALCAARHGTPGSLFTWVQFTSNHHLEHTSKEVQQRHALTEPA